MIQTDMHAFLFYSDHNTLKLGFTRKGSVNMYSYSELEAILIKQRGCKKIKIFYDVEISIVYYQAKHICVIYYPNYCHNRSTINVS